MNFIDSGVTFKDILNAGLVTGGPKIAKGKYKKDANNNITGNMPVVNAIDIDWNKAEIPGINDPITSTGQLLALIGELKQALGGDTPGDEPSSSGIIDRLTALENAVQELQNNPGGSVPADLQTTLDNLSSRISQNTSSIGGLQSAFMNEIPDNLSNRLSSAENKITTLESYHTGQTAAATKADIISLRNALNELEALVNSQDEYRHAVMSKEEYDALTSYSANTLYFITGEPDYIIINNGGGDTPGGDTVLSTNLTINGVKYTTNGKITLSPSSTPYTISGILYGELEIDTTIYDTDLMKSYGDTELILNNVTIVSDNNTAITYKTPEENKGYQGLIINIARNSKNIILCNKNEPRVEDVPQPGAIYSMHDLTIKGTGYIALKNLGGHCIRGTETNICGPHIYCECVHDGVHGKNITVHDGTVYVNQGNDGLGTGDTGKILLFRGNFYGYNLSGDLFDSKNPGFYSKHITLGNGNNTMTNMSELSINTFKSVLGVRSSSIIGYASKYDMDHPDEAEEIEISVTGDRYVTDCKFITISGVIDKPIELITAPKQDCTIQLNNAYLTTALNVPNIYFNPELYNGKAYGKVKVIAKTGINIIENKNETVEFISATTYLGDCIKSENNIDIEAKNETVLYITSSLGDGIDGGTVKINDSKGSIIVTKCGQRGIKSNAFCIGYDCIVNESILQDWIDFDFINSDVKNPDGKYTVEDIKPFSGFCVVRDNCVYTTVGPTIGTSELDKKNSGFADIYGRNGKATKGAVYTIHNGLKGIIIAGSIAAVNTINLGNSLNFHYNTNVTPSSNITVSAPDASVEQYIAMDTNRKDISR